jgi:phage tail sheath gpL-like
MALSFDNIPTTLRVPIFAVEFNSSRAQQGPALLQYQALAIVQKTTAGTATADTAVRVTNVDQAIVAAGRGSIGHRVALAWFANNTQTPLWLGILADNGAGIAATGTIVVSGPATAAGTIAMYLGAERILVQVASGAASTVIATDIAAAINANLDLPVTAAAATSTVTLTFRHKGLVGNSYDVRPSFRDGEVLPTGVGLTITAMGGVVAGTTNPTLTSLIAAISDLWFQVITHPFTDATSLTAIENELASRAGPMRSIDGVAITSSIGNFAALVALGGGRNSAYSEIFAQPGASPLTPPMEFAAAAAAQIALAGQADPARPMQTLALQRVVAPAEIDQWSIDERNLFLFAGIATSKRVVGGGVQIDRAITTYRVSPSGAADTSYLDITTPLTLLYLRFSFRTRFQNRYPRHKLANDGTRFGSGQAVMTPKLGRGEALLWFDEMEKLGLVEGSDQFKRDLVVERNAVDPNRLDFLLPPDLVNQLVVTAAQVQFRL